jgi:hypothetical protein
MASFIAGPLTFVPTAGNRGIAASSFLLVDAALVVWVDFGFEASPVTEVSSRLSAIEVEGRNCDALGAGWCVSGGVFADPAFAHAIRAMDINAQMRPIAVERIVIALIHSIS